jgi:hypothetical protein
MRLSRVVSQNIILTSSKEKRRQRLREYQYNIFLPAPTNEVHSFVPVAPRGSWRFGGGTFLSALFDPPLAFGLRIGELLSPLRHPQVAEYLGIRWRHSLRSEQREAWRRLSETQRRTGNQAARGRRSRMMMYVCVHAIILTLCTATDALDGQGRPSALAHVPPSRWTRRPHRVT